MPWVNSYIRADGTKVQGYSRWAAGARNEMFKVVLFAVAVVAIGGGTGGASVAGTGGSGELPKPRSTVVYPIKFPGQVTKPAPRPVPTVSYPIKFDRSQ